MSDLKTICLYNEFDNDLPIDPVTFEPIQKENIIEIYDRCYDNDTIRQIIEKAKKENKPPLDPYRDPIPKSIINSFTNLTINYQKLYLTTIPILNLNLIELNISNNEIVSIAVLANLKKILKLDCSFNKIKDISSLSQLKTLKELYTNNNQIESIPQLSNTLEIIDLSHNNIKDITKMDNLINVNKIKLNNNNIQNISPLNKSNKLIYLNISNNIISNIKNICNLEDLNKLYLKGNSITDSKFLGKLNKLIYLNIENTNIKNEDLDFLRVELKNTQIEFTQESPITLKKCLEFSFYVIAVCLVVYFIYLSYFLESKILRESLICILGIILIFLLWYFLPYFQYLKSKYDENYE